MRFDILTLFPNIINSYLNESIIKRAIDNKYIEVNVINIRDFTTLKNNQVDDAPYGGGSGMVIMCDPVVRAIESVRSDESLVYLLSPQGKTFCDFLASKISKETKHLILICGHYEGIDERIKYFIDAEISIGDYVLTGGELPALVVMDSIARNITNVIKEESLNNDSFKNNLLDYPVYTKPREYRGHKVPDILLSGNHEEIRKYRENEKIRVTKEKRPDLLK